MVSRNPTATHPARKATFGVPQRREMKPRETKSPAPRPAAGVAGAGTRVQAPAGRGARGREDAAQVCRRPPPRPARVSSPLGNPRGRNECSRAWVAMLTPTSRVPFSGSPAPLSPPFPPGPRARRTRLPGPRRVPAPASCTGTPVPAAHRAPGDAAAPAGTPRTPPSRAP